jgi:hypothetical protein
MPLATQLDMLAAWGIRPNPAVEIPDLLLRFPEQAYERSPFKLLLTVLGDISAHEPFLPLSDNIWHLDAKCIGGPGDYAHVARRMAALAGDALPLANFSDSLDLRQGTAWLSFTLGEREFHWPAKVEEDWIDPNILSRFVALLDSQDTDRRFTLLDFPGRDCLIGCSTPAQFKQLRKSTGLTFEWLA